MPFPRRVKGQRAYFRNLIEEAINEADNCFISNRNALIQSLTRKLFPFFYRPLIQKRPGRPAKQLDLFS